MAAVHNVTNCTDDCKKCYYEHNCNNTLIASPGESIPEDKNDENQEGTE